MYKYGNTNKLSKIENKHIIKLKVIYIKIIKKISLYNCESFNSGIYNNCTYKFTHKDNAYISLYKNDLKYIDSIEICNSYSTIALFNDSYIAAKKNTKDKLYLLNKHFVEYEEIKLNIPKEFYNEIICIFYDNRNKKILIATSSKVYSTSIDGYFIKCEYTIKNQNNQVYTCCNQVKNSINCNKNIITSVGIFCNKKYIGIIENNSAYLEEISNNGNIINKYYIDDNIIINSIINKNNSMQLLITKDNKYNCIYITNYTCYKCHKKIKCNNSKYDIITSIAYIEFSLSNILNSESKKIQKALNCTNKICEILSINESVNKTIMNITMLEQILYEKLKIVI